MLFACDFSNALYCFLDILRDRYKAATAATIAHVVVFFFFFSPTFLLFFSLVLLFCFISLREKDGENEKRRENKDGRKRRGREGERENYK